MVKTTKSKKKRKKQNNTKTRKKTITPQAPQHIYTNILAKFSVNQHLCERVVLFGNLELQPRSCWSYLVDGAGSILGSVPNFF